MTQTTQPPEGPQCAAVEAYISELQTDFARRYWWSCFHHRLWTCLLQVLAMLATGTTAVLAGVYSVEGLPGVLLVALPAAATVLLGIRGVLNLPEVWRRREGALIEFRGLATRAKQRLAACKSEGDCGKLHRELEAWARRLEREAMISTVGSIKGAVDTTEGDKPPQNNAD